MAANSVPLSIIAKFADAGGTRSVFDTVASATDDAPDYQRSIAALDLPSKVHKSIPPLISEGADGEIVFTEEARISGSARQRKLAELLFDRGIHETRLVNAMYCRETASFSGEEVGLAKEIVYGARVLREEEKLRKTIKREEAKGPLASDPFKLERLDEKLRQVFPFAEEAREKKNSAKARVLQLVQILERIGEADRKAKRWKSKALRHIACGVYAHLYEGTTPDGVKCGTNAYCLSHCGLRYCLDCGPHRHNELYEKYLRLKPLISEFLAANPSYGLKILDLTAIKRSDRMPSSADVHRFQGDVKELIDRINRKVAKQFRLRYSKKLTGYLYCLEFGFNNSNLHCHGMLLSPYVEQDWISQQWREIRGDGSFRVLIEEARSTKPGVTGFESALWHSLEYVGKYVAEFSPERAFELEVAFEDRRRVDTLGWFSGRLPKEDDVTSDLRCPCGNPECFLKLNRDAGWLPVSWFKERGVRSLGEVLPRVKEDPHVRGSPRKWMEGLKCHRQIKSSWSA